MRIAGCVVAAIGLVIASRSAQGQSFDCGRAQSVTEKAVCASKALRAADAALAAQYKAELAAAPAEVQTELRGIQRKWLAELPEHCKESAGGSTAAGMPMEKCLLLEYKGEKAELERHVMRRGDVLFVLRSVKLLDADGPDEAEYKGMEENPGFGTLNASWPEAISYPAAQAEMWKAFNTAVLRATQGMAGVDEKEIGGAWKKDWAGGSDADVTAALGAVNAQRVSVALSDEEVGHGAAHPNEAYIEFHWMLQERRKLAVGDVPAGLRVGGGDGGAVQGVTAAAGGCGL